MRCGVNKLTDLDVSKNTMLTTLFCSYNQLTALDVSKNTALTILFSYNIDPLISLNIKNGNNATLSNLYATNNPSLTCIQVDDVADANGYSLWGKDAIASYSTNCGMLNLELKDPGAIFSKIYAYHKTVYVDLPSQTSGTVLIYNVTGQLVKTSKASKGLNKIDVPDTGVYLVRLLSGDNSLVKKVFIQ